jgi:hypothetical protein
VNAVFIHLYLLKCVCIFGCLCMRVRAALYSCMYVITRNIIHLKSFIIDYHLTCTLLVLRFSVSSHGS